MQEAFLMTDSASLILWIHPADIGLLLQKNFWLYFILPFFTFLKRIF